MKASNSLGDSVVLTPDVLIVGGGIAGLWSQELLRKQGYYTVLIEKDVLGGEQTLASQGMIHGGQRYSLTGQLSEHTQQISAMPAAWNRCLAGDGEIDLRKVAILSEVQYLFSEGGFLSSAAAFFASKVMQASMRALKRQEYPSIFSNSFCGRVYELPEKVIDAQSLVLRFAGCEYSPQFRLSIVECLRKGDSISEVICNEQVRFVPKCIVFLSGAGNEWVDVNLRPNENVSCQRRPLKQVIVRGVNRAFYGHCVTADPRPRVTVTSHPYGDAFVWYLGGLVATRGTEMGDREAVRFALSELETLFPGENWRKREFSVHLVDRGEPKVASGWLPEKPILHSVGNWAWGWPTKMTFAPLMGRMISDWVKKFETRSSAALVSTHFPALDKHLSPRMEKLQEEVPEFLKDRDSLDKLSSRLRATVGVLPWNREKMWIHGREL